MSIPHIKPIHIHARPGTWWCKHCGNVNMPTQTDKCSSCTWSKTPIAMIEYNTVSKQPRIRANAGGQVNYSEWIRNVNTKYGWFCLSCNNNKLLSGPSCPTCHEFLDDQVFRASNSLISCPWNMPEIFPKSTPSRNRVTGILQNTIPRQRDGGHTAFIVIRLNGRPTKILGFLKPGEPIPPNGFEVSFELVASDEGNKSNSFVATKIRGESRFKLRA